MPAASDLMTTPAPDRDQTVPMDTETSTAPGPPASDAQLVPGTIVARRYRIAGILGRGGMGEVYRADDLKLGQPVALKFLPARLVRDPVLLEHLHGEVRLGRLIAHPNVCRIYDIVDWLDGCFVAMEYVEGEDLARLLRRIGRLTIEKALDLARGIAAGLQSVHAKGILHRDLKPANVMVDSHGEARLTDFGLALAAAADQGGVLAGTPAYLAPEQLRGEPATVQSDLYALGLVTYELLTGRRVHAADGLRERLRTLGGEVVPPSTLVPGIDPAVERIVLRCLAPDPRDRPRSAREVMAALPGGDPLAAVLAAGRTPSPGLVAAAGTAGSLRPAVAWSLLALIGVELALGFQLFRDHGLLQVLQPKSPVVLAERAAVIRDGLGLPAQPFQSSAWERNFQETAAAADGDRSPRRWERLRDGPAVMWFWVRHEPAPLLRSGGDLSSSRVDPPQVAPGSSTLALDPRGRLLSLLAVPMASWKARPLDWSRLFVAAGLDPARLEPTEPRVLPPVFADARAGWTGRHPDDGTPIHVDAAAWRGTPVHFRVAAPWDERAAVASGEAFAPSARGFGAALSAAVFICAALGALFAWRNLRLGRGDRRGALRLAAALFVLRLVGGIGFADHAASVGHETRIALAALANALLWASGYSLVYLALEPYVRRHWPHCLIAWSRLLAGNWRDPMVGRDVSIGLAAGLAHSLLFVGVPVTFGMSPAIGSIAVLQSAFAPFAWMAQRVHYGAVLGLALTFGLVVLTIVLRRRVIGQVATFAVLLFVYRFLSTDPRMLPGFVAVSALMAFLVVPRFGLLATAVYSVALYALAAPLPSAIAWYTARLLVVPVALATLAIWAFRISLGGRSPWHPALLQD
jgi:protein kinase-like protein